MKPNGSLRFFKSGTNTTLVTYKDELETIANPTIVPVLPNGNVQNVFYQGSAKVIYLDEFDQQYAERDPVGGEKELGDFTLWDTTVTYDLNDIVEGSDGKFYISLSNGNQANDPTTTPTEWAEIRFIGVWNTNILYAIGDVVQTSDGNLWKALTASAGNNPSTDDGSNWLPAIDSANVLSDTNTVIPLTGGGALTALRVNELQDAGAYTIPLANTVSANQVIIITQPDEFISFEPVITVSGSDTITDSDGTDTSITFDNTQSIEITLTSDGVSDWRL
tara:strand:+ start:811 stop:1641 length:831 start_codon:yes stop_codon:yes gene_type:complete